MKRELDGLIVPRWGAPTQVGAACTRRSGGVSAGPWGDARGSSGLNLGAACGDEPQSVATNRARLAEAIGMPIRWLQQVHGADVVKVGRHDAAPAGRADAAGLGGDRVAVPAAQSFEAPRADAQFATESGVALAVLVADCLPVLLADRAGTIVGAAHAGWRGLAAGVLENTVARMRAERPHAELVAWLGPCIGPAAFEVGAEVREAFVSPDPEAARHFVPALGDGKWLADLAALARHRLQRAGVAAIAASGACTVQDAQSFWSYRRDRTCGRMAALVWLIPQV
ncbi:MAG: peptidoglycan editing factor PgeF [Burkholderiaceae bacterium]|nr:peptidoglycan editing factor PgeF [Burkholderiaceae bacterium]